MKKVKEQEILEFTYDSEEEREHHVKSMVAQGWQTSDKVKRMIPGRSIWNSTEDDYEWYADFWRYHH